MPSFDWYQATVRAPLEDVMAAVADLAPPAAAWVHGKGHHGYSHCSDLPGEDGHSVARVWHGGTHAYPHVLVSGDDAPAGVELIRAAFPELHTVSRADVREDFAGAGAYDLMQAQLVDAAARHRVRVGTAGDHLLTKQGRTCYLGAASSNVRMRLYDKAAELRSKLANFPERLASIPEHLTRLESQIRPQGAAKAVFASIEPVEALGCAAWTREVWKAVAGLELQPVQVGKAWRPGDDERAYRFLLSQYGGLLRRMRDSHGGWDCVGLQIGDDLTRLAALSKRQGRA